MVRIRILSLSIAVLLIGGLALAGGPYQVDAIHSHIGFAVRHFGVSNVRGQFKSFDATLTVDEADLTMSSVEVKIRADSIFTDHEERDNHLRSADFLDVENHPEIVFKSKRIEKDGDDYLAVGDLTIRGQTREVEFPVTVAGPLKDPLGLMRIGIEGRLTIDRRDYGVAWSRVMESGGLFVGNDVKIDLSIEAARRVE
jgi:polyisoprenoid-binding protein YceI